MVVWFWVNCTVSTLPSPSPPPHPVSPVLSHFCLRSSGPLDGADFVKNYISRYRGSMTVNGEVLVQPACATRHNLSCLAREKGSYISFID